MHIEFKTVFDEFINEQLAQLYVKYFMENQMKKYNQMIGFSVVVAACALILGITLNQYSLCLLGGLYFFAAFLIVNKAKKKLLPKSISEINGVGCPYNVTFGFYDEYFYEKFENNMSIQESSIRYEFLKKIVETSDCFILMTKRSNLFYLPKKDMGYENVSEFSAFCKSRLPYIYTFKD